MARGRMLSKDISLDEKVDALSNDTARLLFTWLIPHLDVEGRMYGDARLFKSIVAPRRNYSVKKVEKMLTEMEKLGLITRYSVDGNQYLYAPNFEKHQIGLRKDKESKSKIPDIGRAKAEQRRSKDGISPPQEKRSLSIREEKEKINRKRKGKEDMSQDKRAKEIWKKCLEILKGKVSRPYYGSWLEGTVGLLYKETVFIIGVPSEHVGGYLMGNQRSMLENVLMQVTKKRLGLGYRIIKKEQGG